MTFLNKNFCASILTIFFLIFIFCFSLFLKSNPLANLSKNKVIYDISSNELKDFSLNDSNLKLAKLPNIKQVFVFNINSIIQKQGLEIRIKLINNNSKDNDVFIKLFDKNFKEIIFNNNSNTSLLTILPLTNENNLIFTYDNILKNITSNNQKTLKNINIAIYTNSNIEKISILKLFDNFPLINITCYILLSLLYSILLISIFYILYSLKDKIFNLKNIIKISIGAFIITCLIEFSYGFNWNFFKVPLSFSGEDDLHFLSVAKNAIDGHGFWNMEDMQAPFGTKRYNFPMLMAFYYGFFRFFGFFTDNVILVNNFYYICTFIFAFYTFYFVARKLSILPSLCILGGIIFTFSQYHFLRSVIHITASSYFVAPLILYFCYLIGIDNKFNKKYVDLKEKLTQYALITFFCFLIGSADIFYAYFGCGFIVVSIFISFFKNRRLATLRGIIILLLLIAFLLSNLYPSILNSLINDASKSSSRRPFEAFYYGLMFVHLFMPKFQTGDHVFSWLVDRYKSDNFFKGEALTNYLGIIALVGFLFLIALLILDGLCKKFENKEDVSNKGFIRFLSSLNFFGFFLGCSAGLATFISLCGFTEVRTYNRISVYLLLFSTIFVIYTLNILTKNYITHSKKLKIKFLYFISIFSLILFHFYDTRLYNLKSKDEFVKNYEKVLNVKNYAEKINALYDKKVNILELPIIPYPESKIATGQANCNIQAMPYLFTKNVSWSFGSLPRSETLFGYKQLFSKVDASSLISNALNYEFSGISIHTNLFPKGKNITKELYKLGIKPSFKDEQGEVYFYDLTKIDTNSIKPNQNQNNMINFNKYLFKGFLINEYSKNSKDKWGLGDISKHEEYFKSVLKFFSPINKPYQIELNFYSPIKNKLEIYLNDLLIGKYDINTGNNKIITNPIIQKSISEKKSFMTLTLQFKNGSSQSELFKVNSKNKLVTAKFNDIHVVY